MVLALLSVLTVTACGSEKAGAGQSGQAGQSERAERFPHAFPGSPTTDVSAEQAFRDHQVAVPGSARVIGYYAWSEDDEYPMAAELRLPCSAVAGVVSGSKLVKASSRDGEIAAVQVFARSHGWSDDTEDQRYLRIGGPDDVLGALVHATGTECTMYLNS
ncbi:hypothetical protein V2W30_24500 [Streptomyces sp. Q6]|uniref:Uncharacterized protein n=1 Tax=Streptomyces citrinus TaxID=3118173 RepID=A0ACD5AG82_9ACTN